MFRLTFSVYLEGSIVKETASTSSEPLYFKKLVWSRSFVTKMWTDKKIVDLNKSVQWHKIVMDSHFISCKFLIMLCCLLYMIDFEVHHVAHMLVSIILLYPNSWQNLIILFDMQACKCNSGGHIRIWIYDHVVTELLRTLISKICSKRALIIFVMTNIC